MEYHSSHLIGYNVQKTLPHNYSHKRPHFESQLNVISTLHQNAKCWWSSQLKLRLLNPSFIAANGFSTEETRFEPMTRYSFWEKCFSISKILIEALLRACFFSKILFRTLGIESLANCCQISTLNNAFTLRAIFSISDQSFRLFSIHFFFSQFEISRIFSLRFIFISYFLYEWTFISPFFLRNKETNIQSDFFSLWIMNFPQRIFF